MTTTERALHAPNALAREVDPNAAVPVVKALTELVQKEIDEWRNRTLTATGCCVFCVSSHFAFVL